MQTWLPDKDFVKSAGMLRDKELGRQRVDAKIAINALVFPERKSAWRFHPVCRMWKGYEHSLIDYYEAIVCEWKRRGHKHTMALDKRTLLKLSRRYLSRPWWLGQYGFHEAQRATLIRRFGEHYEKQFSFAWEDMGPVWPVTRNGGKNKLLHPYRVDEDIEFTLPF